MSGRTARAVVVVAALTGATGCRLLVELVEADGDGDGDAGVVDAAGPDAFAVDPECETWTFAPAALDACALPAPGDALVLGAGAWELDTNSGALTDPAMNASFPVSALVTPPGGVEVRVLSVERFELEPGAELRVHGARPLLIVAWTDAVVDGVMDATSRPESPGAGADPEACEATAATRGDNSAEGAGGGGGGGFGGPGAPGGTGDDTRSAAGAAGLAAEPPVGLRGGCRGAGGGNSLHGVGGAGGGAVYLAARDQLVIDGVITAGGAGGGASQGGRSGGGGGGSGGFIGLASAFVEIGLDAIIAANGGGGGGGSDNNEASPGSDGEASATPAPPGGGEGMGAGGGAGGARDDAPDPGLSARRGGGGGGGGVGWIELVGAETDVAATAILSPAPRTP